MSRLGADVAELEAIAAELQGYARRIDGARGGIDHALSRTAWTGPDADAFRRRWRTIAVRDLDGFRSELTSSAAELRRQATQQRVASSGSPGAASGLVVGHFASALMGGALGVGALAARAGRAAGAFGGSSLAAGAVGAGGGGGGGVRGGAGAAAGWWGLLGGPVGTVGGVMGLMYGGAAGTLVAGAVVASRSNIDARTVVTGTKFTVGNLLTAAGTFPKEQLLELGTRKGVVSGAGLALTFGSAVINGGFDRWNADAGSDMSRSERVGRAGSQGVVEGSVVAGGAKAGALAGAKFGAFGGPKGIIVGAAVGAVVGGIGGAEGGKALLNSDTGRAVTDGIVDVAGRTTDAVVSGARSATDTVVGGVTSAKGAVTEGVGGAVSEVRGWFK